MASAASFESLGLDYRVLRSIEKRQLSSPTDVQIAVIGKALKGKDIVAQAHTGSGKTLAYLAPAIHSVLQQEDTSAPFQVIVLVPTSELCEQVRKEATSTAVHCGANLRATVLTNSTKQQSKQISITSSGQVVVATPGRLAAALHDKSLSPALLAANLKVLVLDEADLLLSYGYEADLRTLQPLVPRSAQCMLMSATTSSDVDNLAKLMLHNACHLNLCATSASAPTSAPAILHTFAQVATAQDRLLSVLALLRLNLVKKKVLLFTNSPESAYRVRLLLEAFGTRAGTLVATLPLASRHSAIEQFNAGAFDVLVASEASAAPANRDSSEDTAEFGVTRGVDFKGVRTVVNVEAPADMTAYTHRVGRTGRAGAEGLAITIIGPGDEAFLETLRAAIPLYHGRWDRGLFALEIPRHASRVNVLPTVHVKANTAIGLHAPAAALRGLKITDPASCASHGPAPSTEDGIGGLQPLRRLKADAVNALRYRAEDVLRGLTKKAVQEARSRDLKLEVLNCSRLQEFFEAHKADAAALKHDKQLTKDARRVKHLRHMPDYLRSSTGVGASVAAKGAQRRSVKRMLRPDDDPLKKKVMFSKAEELTELEVQAQKLAKKTARKQAKAAVPVFKKENVRKRR